MRDKTILIAGVAIAAAAAYFYFKSKNLSPEQIQQSLESAGAKTYYGTMPGTESKLYAKAGKTTFAFQPGDFNKLNLAQKTFIALDKIMPGTFLTKWALT